MLSAYYIMRLLEEAGMPPGVINFVAGDSSMISKALLSHRDLAGVHFTGSTGVFNDMWKTIGASMASYRSYPRIVGETGGKDFIVAHPSADPAALATAIVRGGFEYQGQKCSAVSRVYVPKSLWDEVRDRMVAMIDDIKMGDLRDFRNFMGAVIDRKAFDSITRYVDHAKQHATIVRRWQVRRLQGLLHRADARADRRPRLQAALRGDLRTGRHRPRLRRREVGRDAAGGRRDVAVRAHRRGVRAATAPAVREAMSALRNAAGNFYINDKPTGRGRRAAAVRRRARARAPTTRRDRS